MAQVWFPGVEPHHSSVRSCGVVATHIEENDGLRTGTYDCVLGLQGGEKKELNIRIVWCSAMSGLLCKEDHDFQKLLHVNLRV